MSAKKGKFHVITGEGSVEICDILEKVYQDAQWPLIFHTSLPYYRSLSVFLCQKYKIAKISLYNYNQTKDTWQYPSSKLVNAETKSVKPSILQCTNNHLNHLLVTRHSFLNFFTQDKLRRHSSSTCNLK